MVKGIDLLVVHVLYNLSSPREGKLSVLARFPFTFAG